jgi:hypothetical protein
MTYTIISKAQPAGFRNTGIDLGTHTTTVDTYVELERIETMGLTNKRILVNATTKDITLAIVGYLSDTIYYTIGEVTILAGDSHAIRLTSMYNYLGIQIKPAVAGQHGSLTVSFSGDNTTHEVFRSTFAYESVAVTNAAAVAFTRDTMDSCLEVLITVETNPIRFRTDGVAPTTTEGHLLSSGDSITLESSIDALNFKAIATGGNATLRVSYLR